jgi:acyl-CoA synthetase (AMP-forming)/AMP-acid ligase II
MVAQLVDRHLQATTQRDIGDDRLTGGGIVGTDHGGFGDNLPKTRSGKIMRRLLRDVAEGRNLGDTTTLADASVVSELQRRAAEAPTED